MSLLIKNASFILTQNTKKEILKNTDIFIEDDKITGIGKNLNQSAEFVIDGRNKLVIPGLINSHTHLAMTLFRGVADDLPLMDWLKNYIWPMEMKLTAKDVYYGSLLGCLELIKTGTTCFGDMYFFEEEVGKAIEASGIRGLISSVVVDLLPKEMASVDVMVKTLKAIKELKCDRAIPWLGPHATYSCSPETLQKIKEIAQKENLRINIHLSETKSEVKEIKQKYGKTPIEFLESLNFLGPDTTAIHCVYPTKREIEILKERDTKIVHNPVSNMKTASGVSPVPEMVKQGICVALGTDGAASNNRLDLFQEMKIAALIHKVNKLNPTVLPAEKVLEFATINGAKSLGLERQVGSIEVRKKADIVILNLNDANLRPIISDHSITSHLVYSATGSNVKTVVVDGKIIMENGKILTLEEENVIEKFQGVVEGLQNRARFKPL
jgi:5-methylthioadenosine/S-adenosylhomocysteine deaminase